MVKKLLFIFLFTFISQYDIYSQCDISDLQVTPVTGSCASDTEINIQIQGATSCSNITATIQGPVNRSSAVSSNGLVNFVGLPPGDYTITILSATESVTYSGNPVTTSTTYNIPTVTTSSTSTSCASDADFYSPDGTVTLNRSGGNGPFIYEVRLGSTVEGSYGPTSDASHTFTDLGAGDYNVAVIDQSATCGAEVLKGITVGEPSDNPMQLTNTSGGKLFFSDFDSSNCNDRLIHLTMLGGDQDVLAIPGNATVSYGGSTYDLVDDTATAGNGTANWRTPPIPVGTTFTLSFNDGCNEYTFTDTLPDFDFYRASDFVALDSDCNLNRGIQYFSRNQTGNFEFALGVSGGENTSVLLEERPTGSGNFVEIGSITNDVSGFRNAYTDSFRTPDGDIIFGNNYRVDLVNSCGTITGEEFIVDAIYDGAPSVNLSQAPSMLQGTGGVIMGEPINNSFGKNSTITIERTDGVESITINPEQPLSLAGSYTINFPLEYTFASAVFDPIYIGNLPPGEYKFTYNYCDLEGEGLITVNELASYSPEIDVVPVTCANNTLFLDMNQNEYVWENARTVDDIEINLYESDSEGSLTPGAFISTYNLNGLKAEFNNLPEGNYVVEFKNVDSNNDGLDGDFDATISPLTLNSSNFKSYYAAITVPPYEQVSFQYNTLFCDDSDPNSGIIALNASGTPIGSITYSLWDAAGFDDTNPGTPLFTYSTTDLSELEHVFQNVPEGEYISRVITDCGFTQQDIDLNILLNPFPAAEATETAVCEDDNEVTLGIPLSNTLYDITWTSSEGVIGTGNRVTTTITNTETFTASYQIKSVFNCSDDAAITSDIEVVLNENVAVDENSINTICGVASYQVEFEVTSGAAPYTVIDNNGVELVGSWSGNLFTSDPIEEGEPYYFSISDDSSCNDYIVSGTAPTDCCVSEYICPNYPALTVQCYEDITIPEDINEATACGAMEITATNSPDSGECSQTVIRTYTYIEYDDINGNLIREAGEDILLTVTCEQTINVEDTTAPMFVETLPADVTVDCEVIPTAETLTATDNCGTATVTFAETETAGDCPNSYSLLREWTATDECGLTTVHTQTITVEDTTAPTFVETLPTDITVTCDAIPTAPTLTATDNCGTATVTFTETETAGDCPNNYSLLREWTATDECGLTTVHTQTITVEDTTAPTFVETLPADVTVTCNAIPTAEILTALDNCGTATVTFTETETAGDCPNSYSLLREWTATDECGLTTVHTQTINVEDTTAPTFVETLPTDITVDCETIPTAETLTATDNCGTGTVTFTEVINGDATTGCYEMLRTWTATDECGLTTVHTQTITVEDTTAPTFVETLPTDITVTCNAIPTAETLTATDNCGTATVTFTETGTCSDSDTIEREWIATDECGNTTVHTQTITLTSSESGIEILKDGVYQDTNNDGIVNLGDQVLYTFTVRNTGETDLTNVTVSDPKVTVIGGPLALLTPGTIDNTTFTATYMITQSDIDAGGAYNLATVTGTNPDGDPVTETSTDPTPVDPADPNVPPIDPSCPDCTITDFPDDLPPPPPVDADIAIYKTISKLSAVLNEEIEFMVTAENVGAVDATNIVVSDKLPNGYNFIGVTTAAGSTYNEITGQFTISELAVGESAVFVIRVAVTNIEDYINVARLESLDQEDINDTNDVASAGADLVISECFEIFNEFTPNNDGKNDYFTISCIENFPGNTVDIYNRWGIKVYSAKDYQNNWDGTSEGRATISKDAKLPTGTYYYVIDLNNGSKAHVGWLYIN